MGMILIDTNAVPDSCIFTGCEFRYGGRDGYNMVEVRGGPAVFTGCEFMNSNRSGLHVRNASPSVTGCTFGESYRGLSMDGTSMATNVSGNTFGPQSDNSYVVSVTADCMGDVVGQNVFQLRSNGESMGVWQWRNRL